MKIKKTIVVILFVAILVSGFFITKSLTGNVVKEDTKKHLWIQNNCECLAYDNKKCPDGFKWDKNVKHCAKDAVKCEPVPGSFVEKCRDIVQYSPVVWGCSQYQCEEGIYEVKL